MKKILPLNSKNVLASYSFHAYISSILLDDKLEETSNGWFSNLKILSSVNNTRILNTTIEPMLKKQGNIGTPVSIKNLNEIPCHIGDITGVKDSFNYIYSLIDGDGSAEVKIEYLKNTSVWTKSGLMIRDSLEVDSKYVYIFATPSVNGIVIQKREVDGNENDIDFTNTFSFPIWLKLERQGNKINLYYANEENFDNWTLTKTFYFDFQQKVYIGLASCSPEKQAFLNWYSSNYIQLYCYKDFNIHAIPLDFNVGFHKEDFYSFCPYIRTNHIWYSVIEKLEQNDNDIVDIIISFLEDGNYVDIKLDEYYVPERSAYQRNSRIHSNLIYGYDYSNSSFYIAGYANGDIFKKSLLSFDNFRHAFNRNTDNKIDLIKLHPYYNYKINSQIIKKQLLDHLNSVDTLACLSMNRNFESRIVYGLNVYDSLIKNFSTSQYDIRPLHVVYEHKKIMVMRLKHLYESDYFLDGIIYKFLYNEYKNLEQLALITRNLQLKNIIQPLQKTIDIIKSNIHEIKMKESELIPILIDNIKDE